MRRTCPQYCPQCFCTCEWGGQWVDGQGKKSSCPSSCSYLSSTYRDLSSSFWFATRNVWQTKWHMAKAFIKMITISDKHSWPSIQARLRKETTLTRVQMGHMHFTFEYLMAISCLGDFNLTVMTGDFPCLCGIYWSSVLAWRTCENSTSPGVGEMM